MAKLIKTDGTVTEVKPKNGRVFELDELQAFVGGYIQFIFPLPGQIVCLNEEGKIHGLEYNAVATELVAHALLPGDVIVGNALVMSEGEVE